MNDKTGLKKVSEETMRFMRGKYVLDEVGDGLNNIHTVIRLNQLYKRSMILL